MNPDSEFVRPVPYMTDIRQMAGALELYHDAAYPGDTIGYLTSLWQTRRLREGKTPPDRREVGMITDVYLRKWGRMGRILASTPQSDFAAQYRRKLRACLSEEWSLLTDLRDVPFWNLGANVQEVAGLFDRLLEHLTVPEIGKRGPVQSPVLVGKLLHILLPQSCIIWDSRYVLDRGLQSRDGERVDLTRDGSGYLTYLEWKAEQIVSISARTSNRPEELADQIERDHAIGLKKMFPRLTIPTKEPITKVLDEVNYFQRGGSP